MREAGDARRGFALPKAVVLKVRLARQTTTPCGVPPAGYRVYTVIMRVIAPPLDQLLKLHYSVTKRVSTPNGTFSDSYRRDLSNATLLGTDALSVTKF